jgi:hypothetical protein
MNRANLCFQISIVWIAVVVAAIWVAVVMLEPAARHRRGHMHLTVRPRNIS